MSKAFTLLRKLKEQKVKFTHDKKFYTSKELPTNKVVDAWVEELYSIAAPEIGKKAIIWAQEQMQKYYGKLSKEALTLIDKQLKVMPF